MTQLIIPAAAVSSSAAEEIKGTELPSQDHSADPAATTAATSPNDSPKSVTTSSTAESHPLQTAWTFRYDKKVRVSHSNGHGRKESDAAGMLMDSEHYAKNLKDIHTFQTVEEFYRAFAFIKKPSELPIDFNISLFRQVGGESYKPMWEDFPKGGMWIIRIKRGQTIDVKNGKSKKSKNGSESVVQVPLIDVMFENLVLSCIGELFGLPEVVGTVLSIRSKENVLSVWNIDNDNPAVRFRVGQKLREICSLPANTIMRYKDFQQAMKDCSSYRNAQKFVFTSDEKDIKTPQGRKNSHRPITVTASPSTFPQNITITSPPIEECKLDTTTTATNVAASNA